jgi:hypothetical protein
MVALVCGSRNWTDEFTIAKRVRELPEGSIIIHGGADGADAFAHDQAHRNGLHTAVVLPLWDKYGRAAGPKRNHAMLDLRPDLVIAFSTGSQGTQTTIDEARRRGISVEVFGKEKT